MPAPIMKMDKRWVIPNTEILGYAVARYALDYPVRPSTCWDLYRRERKGWLKTSIAILNTKTHTSMLVGHK